MAKDKKRGFFSWFGRGRQEEEQQEPETRVEQPVESTPADAAQPETRHPQDSAVVEDAARVAEESEPAEAPGVPIENRPGEWDASTSAEAAVEIEPIYEPVREAPAEPEPQVDAVAKDLAAEELAEEVVAVTEQVAAAQQEHDVVEEFVESD